MKNSLFIFRKDLRLEDNIGLNSALKNSKSVIPAFILDPRQLNPHPYLSINAKQFLFSSLFELNEELKLFGTKLHLFYGTAEQVISDLILEQRQKNFPLEAIFFNRDYTPFSQMRDEAILKVCQTLNINLFAEHDALLNEPKNTTKADGKPYTVFTPFYKKNSKIIPPKPASRPSKNWGNLESNYLKEISILETLLPQKNNKIFRLGGRKEALQILNHKIKLLTNYNQDRNLPAIEGTSGLSAHHKFGTISIRETYWKAKEHLDDTNNFTTELYWRDFFCTIGYFFPHVYKGAFNPQYNELFWDEDVDKFLRWCKGETGFPIVDAGMTELNTTGFMHNRVRMIVSSFLVKDLHINWQWGEKYFAQKLVDYDPAVNNGSWQWSASTGCDAQPYFRIFNPTRQQEKFDPQCRYIKKWIPSLEKYSPKEIHSFESGNLKNYILPIIKHFEAKKETEKRYAEVVRKSNQYLP